MVNSTIDDYNQLYSAWKDAHGHEIKGNKLQKEMNTYWANNKHDADLIVTKINALKAYARKTRTTSGILKWIDTTKQHSLESEVLVLQQSDADPQEIAPTDPISVNLENSSTAALSEDDSNMDNDDIPSINVAPVQQIIKQKIEKLDTDLKRLNVIKNNGVSTPEDLSSFKKKTEEKTKLQKQLKRLQHQAVNSKRCRDKKKRKVEYMKEKFPVLNEVIDEAAGTRSGSGRPSLEVEQPLLLKTIVDIVAPESCTESRRRSELIRACTTLDDLTFALKEKGYKISRSGCYLRLLPRNSRTVQGKKHVTTVPVKLLRAQKTGRKGHQDDHYCLALNKMVRNLAEILGEDAAFVLSQDDKARVVMGIPAATKQAPILMHLDYRVRLPDHDWAVAPGHKLIPSVYAGLKLEGRKLTYSGPTHIAIRSAKHDSSTAATHAVDFRRLLQLDSFRSLALDPGSGLCKPVVIVFTDGGSDENPRFPKVLLEYAKHFHENNLDAVIVVTHAPGQSAYNQVERRMAPLSHDLSGIILPHDFYGTHLDDSGKTVDQDLERLNFKEAGKILAEVWSSNVINGFPVDAEYVDPQEVTAKNDRFSWMNEVWLSAHVRQSQYCLQILKCENPVCCKKWRTNINKILPTRFLPAPVKFKQTSGGIEVAKEDEDGFYGDLSLRLALGSITPELQTFPLDQYCPSVQHQLKDQTCKSCMQYFVTKGALESHKKGVHTSSIESIQASIEAVIRRFSSYEKENSDHTGKAPEPVTDDIVIIDNVSAWIMSDFIDEDA